MDMAGQLSENSEKGHWAERARWPMTLNEEDATRS
jgi:hypothetical protein